MITKIRIFYKSGRGQLIAFIDENQRARWYGYSYKRVLSILELTIGWGITHTNHATTLRRGMK